MGRTACTEPQCLYKGALYLTVELYLYSPYGPYGQYRASVPVEGCTLPYFLPYLKKQSQFKGNCITLAPFGSPNYCLTYYLHQTYTPSDLVLKLLQTFFMHLLLHKFLALLEHNL
jgi:hypothetical protein